MVQDRGRAGDFEFGLSCFPATLSYRWVTTLRTLVSHLQKYFLPSLSVLGHYEAQIREYGEAFISGTAQGTLLVSYKSFGTWELKITPPVLWQCIKRGECTFIIKQP